MSPAKNLALGFRTAAATLVLGVAACSSEQTAEPAASNQAAPPPSTAAAPAPAPAPPSAEPAAPPPAPNMLTPGALGTLRVGEKVPAASEWGERFAQVPGGCRTISSPEFPGAYAIVEDGIVRRITVGERSDVKLADGIGIGATEAQVRAAYPQFVEEPHKYVAAPGKYLTSPDAAKGGPALRFEIGADRKVSLIHAGTMPVLGYVEGCA